MKYIHVIQILLLLTLFSSCEKSIVNEEKGQENAPDSPTGIINEDTKEHALTVAEAQEAAAGTSICVKGYIVGATTKSINNIEFSSPFSASTAIVLSDKRVTNDDQEFYVEDLFPVCLTDASKGIRDAFNLSDNPQYWNQYVYIYGTRDKYLSLPGIKKIQAIVTDPNHVPDSQEDVVTPEDPEDPNVPEDPEENNGNPENPSSTEGYLSVAEARNAPRGEIIKVKGYIVAATITAMKNIDFTQDFKGSTAIVLADKPVDTESTPYKDQFDTKDYSDLMPVCLTDDKEIRAALNLEDNPDNWNHLIYIVGCSDTYMKQPGIRPVLTYEIIP